MIRISEAESQLMDILWRKGATGGEELIGEAVAAHGWSAGTVRTLIARLLQKKAIESRKDGKTAIYRPLLARGDYLHAESRGLINRLFDGEVTALVHHFANHRDLSPGDLEKLKVMIAEIEKKHG